MSPSKGKTYEGNEQEKSIRKISGKRAIAAAESERTEMCGVRLLAASAKDDPVVLAVSRVKGFKVKIRVEPRKTPLLDRFGGFLLFCEVSFESND